MKELQFTVMTGTFVMFEGLSPPTEHTSGYWQSWPTEVESRDPKRALLIMPPETFRFSFFDLQLFPDDAEVHFKEGRLNRFCNGGEMRNRSGFFYPNCIPITAEQAFDLPTRYSSYSSGRQVLVPNAHLSLPSDARYRLQEPGYQIVVGSDKRGHLLTPEDAVISQRQPYPNEFRTLYLVS